METKSKDYADTVERQFTVFMQKTIEGLKKDYDRKQQLENERELLTNRPEVFLEHLNIVYSSEIGVIDEELLEALESLPEKHKLIIEMTAVYDLSATETAENLGTSQQNVSRLRKKAILKLRELLEEWES